ncbi:MAG: hypothetical protein MJE77_16475 [Proteobacteria bacterium]|nr:hypothetical protein [Pseudomonadota bacterium]
MTPLIHLIPLAISALGWCVFGQLNRRMGWFRRGEVIFWDAIFLVVVFLIWLRWY